jgi:hypothetical protein
MVTQVGMSACIIIPIILGKETAGLLLAAYTGFMLIGEVVILLLSLVAIKISIFNLFLYVQLACGILKKASFLAIALLAGVCIHSQGLVGIIVGVLAIVSMLCE